MIALYACGSIWLVLLVWMLVEILRAPEGEEIDGVGFVRTDGK